MSERRRAPVPAMLAALLCAALAGCTVGPDWRAPRAPAEAAYTPRPVVLQGAGVAAPAQRLRPRAALPARWWEAFASPELDATVRRALADSPTLQQARATLRQAREAVLVARGGMLPQLDLQAGATRARASADAPAAELYSAGPLVGYAPDVFGGTRVRAVVPMEVARP